MANCIDQLLCSQTSDCEVLITDIDGNEIDTRYLHSGDTIYLHVSNRVGREFTGFTDEFGHEIIAEEVSEGVYSVTVYCGITYVANYRTIMYSIATEPDSDLHGRTFGDGSYPYGSTITISATENDGYHFVGWYINDTLISNDITYEYVVTDDAEIVAHFEADNYSIIATPEDPNLGVAYGTGVYDYGEHVTIKAEPFEGCRFLYWDDGDTNAEREITVTGNRIFNAIFERIRLRVEIRIVNLSRARQSEIPGIVTGEGYYDYGQTVSLYGSPNEGFSLVSWKNGSDTIEGVSNYRFTITSDTTIVVSFDDDMYTLKLLSMPRGGGYTTNSITPALFTGGRYPYGTQIVAKAMPYTGYEFYRWDDSSTDDMRVFTMTRDITRTAIFERRTRQYMLKINFNGQEGTVKIFNSGRDISNIGGGCAYAVVDEGTSLTVVVTPFDGYEIDDWDDSYGQASRRTFNMIEDIDRTVYFKSKKKTLCLCNDIDWKDINNIVVNNSVGEKIAQFDGESEQYCVELEYGTEVTVIYEKTEGVFNVYRWSGYNEGDVVGTYDGGDTITLRLNEDINALCLVEIPTYYINAISCDNDKGDVVGNGYYTEGENVTLTANASNGYHFMQWSDGNTSHERTITVGQQSMEYVAEFEENRAYLKSNGDQWIDLRVFLRDGVKLIVEWSWEGNGSGAILGSSSKGSYNTTLRMDNENEKLQISKHTDDGDTWVSYDINTGQTTSDGFDRNRINTIVIIAGDKTAEQPDTKIKTSNSFGCPVITSDNIETHDPGIPDRPLFLFASNDSGQDAVMKSNGLRIYSVEVQIYNISDSRYEKLFKLIPCDTGQHGAEEPCMYDTTNYSLCTNSGSGTFTYGTNYQE